MGASRKIEDGAIPVGVFVNNSNTGSDLIRWGRRYSRGASGLTKLRIPCVFAIKKVQDHPILHGEVGDERCDAWICCYGEHSGACGLKISGVICPGREQDCGGRILRLLHGGYRFAGQFCGKAPILLKTWTVCVLPCGQVNVAKPVNCCPSTENNAHGIVSEPIRILVTGVFWADTVAEKHKTKEIRAFRFIDGDPYHESDRRYLFRSLVLSSSHYWYTNVMRSTTYKTLEQS